MNLKFKDGRSVAECLTEFHSLVNQLTTGEDGIRWWIVGAVTIKQSSRQSGNVGRIIE